MDMYLYVLSLYLSLHATEQEPGGTRIARPRRAAEADERDASFTITTITITIALSPSPS